MQNMTQKTICKSVMY